MRTRIVFCVWAWGVRCCSRPRGAQKPVGRRPRARRCRFRASGCKKRVDAAPAPNENAQNDVGQIAGAAKPDPPQRVFEPASIRYRDRGSRPAVVVMGRIDAGSKNSLRRSGLRLLRFANIVLRVLVRRGCGNRPFFCSPLARTDTFSRRGRRPTGFCAPRGREQHRHPPGPHAKDDTSSHRGHNNIYHATAVLADRIKPDCTKR